MLKSSQNNDSYDNDNEDLNEIVKLCHFTILGRRQTYVRLNIN